MARWASATSFADCAGSGKETGSAVMSVSRGQAIVVRWGKTSPKHPRRPTNDDPFCEMKPDPVPDHLTGTDGFRLFRYEMWFYFLQLRHQNTPTAIDCCKFPACQWNAKSPSRMNVGLLLSPSSAKCRSYFRSIFSQALVAACACSQISGCATAMAFTPPALPPHRPVAYSAIACSHHSSRVRSMPVVVC